METPGDCSELDRFLAAIVFAARTSSALTNLFPQPAAISNYSWDMWPGPCPEIPRYLGSLDLPEVLDEDFNPV